MDQNEAGRRGRDKSNERTAEKMRKRKKETMLNDNVVAGWAGKSGICPATFDTDGNKIVLKK